MSTAGHDDELADAGYRTVPDEAGGTAARGWWDRHAAEYLAEHGDFLGAADFVWCPEGLRETDARLLGDVSHARVLEVGAGAAQCSRWLAGRGVSVVATDVSAGMLTAGAALDAANAVRVPTVQADARALPFRDASFDVAFTSFGALPFVPDPRRIHGEVARVLRPGGPFVVSFSNRCFPTKAIRGWLLTDDRGHIEIVERYFAVAGAFDAPVRGGRADADVRADPLYAVWARRSA